MREAFAAELPAPVSGCSDSFGFPLLALTLPRGCLLTLLDTLRAGSVAGSWGNRPPTIDYYMYSTFVENPSSQCLAAWLGVVSQACQAKPYLSDLENEIVLGATPRSLEADVFHWLGSTCSCSCRPGKVQAAISQAAPPQKKARFLQPQMALFDPFQAHFSPR